MWKEFQEKYKLNISLIKVIEEDMKFDKITKVQNVVIPNFLKNKDVIVKSCTGSGKTLAYLIPIFQRLLQEVKNDYLDNDDNDEKNNKINKFVNDDEDICVEKIAEIKNKILALIILPTRELAMQVKTILLKFIEKIKFSYALLIGGKKLEKDLIKLREEIPNIIVATPGRIFDLDEKLNFNYRDLKILVLDEADKMLELGYEVKLTNLFGKFPKQRRTGLFSATINSQIENMIKVGMQNPIFVDIKINLDTNKNFKKNINIKKEIKENKDNKENLSTLNDEENLNENIFINSVKEDISEYSKVIIVDNLNDKKEELINFTQEVPNQLKQFFISFDNIQDKFPYLIYLIKNFYNKKSKFIIFFATCNSVEYFTIVFSKLIESIKDQIFENVFFNENNNNSNSDNIDVNFFKLHSKITQKKRNYEYKRFLECENGILLSTDLSARGIDVPNVDLIIQFDPPKNEEIYIHRVGRTARVGREGLVIYKEIFYNFFIINLINLLILLFSL
jgi:superfamily II DNA/RNA helicase